jgi:predicted nucleotidyltransferase
MARKKGLVGSLDDVLAVIGKKNKATLRERHGITDIAVFGSYMRQEAKPGSDIDIFVDFKEGFKTFRNYMRLMSFLEKEQGGKSTLP